MPGTVDPYSHRTELRWAPSWRRVVGVALLVLLGSSSMVVGGWFGVLQMRVAAQRDLYLRAADGTARSLAEAEVALESAEEASRIALERESVGRTPIADPRVHRIAEQAAENVRRTILDTANGRMPVPGDAVWAAQCVSGASDLTALSCATPRGTVSGYDAAATLYRLGGYEDVLQRVERAALLTALADSGHTELAVGLRQAWERLETRSPLAA